VLDHLGLTTSGPAPVSPCGLQRRWYDEVLHYQGTPLRQASVDEMVPATLLVTLRPGSEAEGLGEAAVCFGDDYLQPVLAIRRIHADFDVRLRQDGRFLAGQRQVLQYLLGNLDLRSLLLGHGVGDLGPLAWAGLR